MNIFSDKKKLWINSIKSILCLVVIIVCAGLIGFILYLESGTKIDDYMSSHYNCSLYQGDLFAKNLCVIDGDKELTGFIPHESFTSLGLFEIDSKQVVYAKNLFDRIYPASTTKIMTAFLTLKYGDLDDTVIITEDMLELGDPEAVVSGLKPGDEVTLKDLLHCLMLFSGNDCGVAIGTHISGSEEEFVKLMNQEAFLLGATNTHFCNTHGLHDENHYTTGYDLYLMFNACIQYPEFLDIISLKTYTVETASRKLTWRPTNFYSLEKAKAPEGVTILGGKTGTTDEAGTSVVLYGLDENQSPFISVSMGAENRDILYENTTALIQLGIVNQ